MEEKEHRKDQEPVTDETADLAEDVNGAEPGEDTMLERLRARREELREERTVDLDVPGYEGLLVIRYRSFPFKKAEIMAKKIRQEKPQSEVLTGSIDTLIEACDQVMIRVGEEVQPIDRNAEPPIRFDSRLADKLGFSADRARDVVVGVFGNEHAIVRQNIQLSQWMLDTTREVDESFLGE